MARISTYGLDDVISSGDLLLGSSLEGQDINGNIYKTRNYRLSDLAVFFSTYDADIGSSLSTSVQQNTSDISALDTRLTTAEGTILSNTSSISTNTSSITTINTNIQNRSNWDEAYSWGDHDGLYALVNHNHNSQYAALNHNHDSQYAALSHNHDDRYYTENEIDASRVAQIDITEAQNQNGDWIKTVTLKNSVGSTIASDTFTDRAETGGGGTDTNYYLSSASLDSNGVLQLGVTGATNLTVNFDDRYYTETEINTTLSSYALSSAIPTNTSDLNNDSGFITDGNTNWNNSYGFITASSTDTLTNKSGNISQWTNNSNYLTSVAFSDLTSTPTTIAGYGITDAFDGNFSSLTGKPDTISGYGITDAFDGVFSSLTGIPTTISGYGITDAFDGAYSSLTGIPTTFTPSSHNHDASQISSGTLSMNRMPTAAITPTGTNLATGAQIHTYITSFNYTTNTGTVDTSGIINTGEYARFVDANTIEARTTAELRIDLSLNNVENVQLSTWAGSGYITTLGTITSGTWQGSSIAATYLPSTIPYTTADQDWNTFTLTAGDFILHSDRDLKENIIPLAKREIKVDFKEYNFKGSNRTRFGVIAQELEEHHPEFVHVRERGEKSVSYIDLLVAKVHELEGRIKELENGARNG